MSNTPGTKQFRVMIMAELKHYLRGRSVTVNGYLKPALLEITKAVKKMMLPIDPGFEKVDGTEENQKLIIHDMEIENPLTVSYDFVNNFIDLPPFGLYDIFNYLIYYSTDYDKQGLAAYKSFDDYRLFEDGYDEYLLTKIWVSADIHLYQGKVGQAMKEKTDEGKTFYDLWFVLEGRGINRGTVLKARCGCKGGRDGGCKHISAAMFSLEDLLNSRGEDLKIGKRDPPLRKKRKNKHV